MEHTSDAVTGERNPAREFESHVESAIAAIKAGLSRMEFMGCEEGDYRWTLYDAYNAARERFKGTTGGGNVPRGYALADSGNVAFSWHPTFEDAQGRATFERDVMGRDLRIVKDIEATWPEYNVGL